MKRLMCLMLWCLVLVSSHARQPSVSLSTDRTTSLIFPFSIRHWDAGNKDILVQQVRDAENLLLVKAAVANFLPTNLSVVTTDGKLYVFELCYGNAPGVSVQAAEPFLVSAGSAVSFVGERVNGILLESYARSLLLSPRMMRLNDKRWEMLAGVTGIYIKGPTIFFHFILENLSPLDYDIDFIRFYIRDKKRGKRTAIQEQEILPLCKVGNLKTVKAHSKSSIVIAVERFTIPDAKRFIIEVGERNGGRHLQLRVTNQRLVRGKLLPDTE